MASSISNVYSQRIQISTIQENIALFCLHTSKKNNSPWNVTGAAQIRICKPSLCLFQELPESCALKVKSTETISSSSRPASSLFLWWHSVQPLHFHKSISCTASFSETSAQSHIASCQNWVKTALCITVACPSQRPPGFLPCPAALEPGPTLWPLNRKPSTR